MTKHEKEDLIAECRRTIKAGTQLQSTYREIALAQIAKIAIASLTAPPVKLPNCVDDLHGVGPVMSADEVICSLKSAGYEFEDESIESSCNGLIAYLNEASDVVSAWPEWKKKGADASKFTRPASEQAD